MKDGDTGLEPVCLTATSSVVCTFSQSSLRLFNYRTKQTGNLPVQIPSGDLVRLAYSPVTGMAALAFRHAGDNDDRGTFSKVVIHDPARNGTVSTLSFKEAITTLVLRPSHLCVVSEYAVWTYPTRDFSQGRRQETFANPASCFAFSTDPAKPVMCCLGLQRGTVRIERFSSPPSTSVIAAHESGIVALALSGNGVYMATVSEVGTLIRVHSTLDSCPMLFEFRRSSVLSPPSLSCLFVSPSGSFIGTIDQHTNIVTVYKTPVSGDSKQSLLLADSVADQATNDDLSVIGTLSAVYRKCLDVLPISSAWASVKVPSRSGLTAKFGEDPHTLVAVCEVAHTVYLYRFDPDEHGSISLARCDQFSPNFEDPHPAGNDEDGALVEPNHTAPEGPDAEGWVVLGRADTGSASSSFW